jgi:[protein-PII] uridylyltransferase
MPAAARGALSRDCLKQQLKADRQLLIAAFHEDGKPEKLLRGLRQSVDAVLAEAWRGAGLPAASALVGVGGYGRGELFPHSDVDLLILLGAPADAITRARLEELVQLLWDLGLEIGSSIRTVDECMSESAADITVQTSLLEARLVSGDEALFEQLRRRYHDALDPQAFFRPRPPKCGCANGTRRHRLQPGAELREPAACGPAGDPGGQGGRLANFERSRARG